MRKTDKNTQRATALTLAAALAVAVYLNWEYAKVDPSEISGESVTANAQVAVNADDSTEESITDELLTDQEALEAVDKTYGEAQLVSVLADMGTAFFEEARLNRTKTRDAVLEHIQESLKDASISKDEKEELTTSLAACLNNITLENEIETLVKAKGMAHCLCFLEDGMANLTVMTSGSALEATQVAQIRDIVLSKCEIDASNITVVEVK